MDDTKKQTFDKYGKYLLPTLCLVVGILIGFLLSPIKNGKVTLFSGNTIGSNNGAGNSAGDGMLGCVNKDGKEKKN